MLQQNNLPLGVHFLDAPVVRDPRGALAFVEGGRHLPFDIRRVFYLFDIAPDQTRGGHAHRVCHQALIALSGSLTVIADDGWRRAAFTLDRPDRIAHVEPGVWLDLQDFAPGTACLVLASHAYEEADYVRRYDDFLRMSR